MKKFESIIRETIGRSENANYERFLEERAGVFEITGKKEQAMFWVLSPMAR